MQKRTNVVSRTFAPGIGGATVRDQDGNVLTVPAGWIWLKAGDAAHTRRVKAVADHWIVQEKKGRKTFVRGLWASAVAIERIRLELQAERSTEAYARKLAAGARRREKVQAEYVENFVDAVFRFLAFHADYEPLAKRMAQRIADHATPVGSGTVARTRRIPIEKRAEAAVIAWMRHQTTGYDQMKIPRVKGKRREVRRMLAERSKQLLERYRRGEPIPDDCPLKRALAAGG